MFHGRTDLLQMAEVILELTFMVTLSLEPIRHPRKFKFHSAYVI